MVAESTAHLVWIAAADGSTVSVKPLGSKTIALPRGGQRSDWLASVHPEDVDEAARLWHEAVSGGDAFESECRLRGVDGEFRWYACSALPVQDARGEIVNWIGTFTEIEDRRQLRDSLLNAERQSAESLSLLETLQSTAPVGFGFVDREFRIVRMNQALADVNGVSIEQQLGRTVEEVIPSLWPVLGPVYRQVLEAGESVVNMEATGQLRGDAAEHTWLTSLYPVRIEHEVIGIGIVTVDITERKAMELELKELSERDPLTGVFNRRQFVVQLGRGLRYAARYHHGGAVLMLDIDNFKLTNDTGGHAVGDQQLKSVAQVLAGSLREGDVVGRLGGDEFAVMLPEAGEEQALTVAALVRSRLYELPIGPPTHVSVGIALFSGDEQMTGDDVLIAADIAMYKVKEAGGDQAGLYSGQSTLLMRQVTQLRDALAHKRFVLYAQPIVDLRSNRVARRELLIRMLSDSGETIPPGEFLPIAERFSLVGELDRWVVDQALTVARHEPVTVNLSARSIGDPRILTAIRNEIAAGLDPRNLVFELTETAVLGDLTRAQEFLSALTQLGCELALDDFGTGFASFAYFKQLPAHYLKIDMQFIRDINDDRTDKQIVRSIVEIGQTLGKETIAEGVETAAVLQTLRELGVDYAQGFYLGAPVPLGPP